MRQRLFLFFAGIALFGACSSESDDPGDTSGDGDGDASGGSAGDGDGDPCPLELTGTLTLEELVHEGGPYEDSSQEASTLCERACAAAANSIAEDSDDVLPAGDCEPDFDQLLRCYPSLRDWGYGGAVGGYGGMPPDDCRDEDIIVVVECEVQSSCE